MRIRLAVIALAALAAMAGCNGAGETSAESVPTEPRLQKAVAASTTPASGGTPVSEPAITARVQTQTPATPPTPTIERSPSPQAAVLKAATSAVACEPTRPDQLGPYFLEGVPLRERIAPEGAAGRPLVISGVVYAVPCQAGLAGAILDVWQADAAGDYDFSSDFLYRGYRGRVTTDEAGRYRFETILPAPYGPRPAHIHIRITHPDSELLVTQLYFDTDDAGVIPELVVPLVEAGGGLSGGFDFVLRTAGSG